jgi:ABC-type bacteriocin/lantibiotic exporter with double-glycine peptidase domain
MQAPATDPAQHVSPSVATGALRDATALLLSHACDALGRPFDGAAQLQTLPLEGDVEPIEWLAKAASAARLRVVPRRMSLGEAVWIAEDTLPVAAWCERRAAWLAITRHGLISARVWCSDAPETGATAMRRGVLAAQLGLPHARAQGDFALLLPEEGAEMCSSARAQEHGHDHAHAMPPVRRLFALLRPDAADLWAIGAFSAVTGLLSLALPLAVNAFISNLSFGARSGPFVQALVAIALVLFACLALAGTLRAIQHVVAEIVQRRIFVRLATDLAHRLPRVELSATDGVHAPELVNRFMEVVTVQKSSALLLLTGIDLLLATTIGLTVLAFYHPFLLALSALLVASLALIVFVGGRGAVPTSVLESVRKYEVVEWLEELARHPRVFKGPGGAEFARARADDLVRGYLQARRGHFRVLLRQIVGLLGLEVVAGTVLLGVGGWLVLNQQLTLGQLVAAEIIVTAIVAAVAKLGKQFEAWYDAVAAVDKLGMLVDLRMERDGGSGGAGSGGMRVQAKALEHRQAGHPSGVGPVDFEVAAGERVAWLGALGSGSSTLLELLAGMRRPSAGSVTVDGVELDEWNPQAFHAQSMLLREGDVMLGTISDNLRLGLPGISQAELVAALEAVGLTQVVHQLPEGLETPLVTGGLPLTGRQRVRLLLARAIVSRPRLLLLDEVLDGLDAATFESLLAVVLDPARDWTVVAATRDPRVAQRFARAIGPGALEVAS